MILTMEKRGIEVLPASVLASDARLLMRLVESKWMRISDLEMGVRRMSYHVPGSDLVHAIVQDHTQSPAEGG